MKNLHPRTIDQEGSRSRAWPRILAAGLAVGLLAATPGLSAGGASGVAPAAASAEKALRLWYDEPAPTSSTPQAAGKQEWSIADIENGWMRWSLPLGNGHFGASVFGGTQTERIQLTENSLRHPYTASDSVTRYNSGMNSFVETYIDFGHASVADYRRDLVLDDATAHVEYTAGGVSYSREYFASYPDNVLAMRFTASQPGSVGFTLKPRIPYVKDYNRVPGDGLAKTGTVAAEGDTITVGGTLSSYGIEYEGQYKVIPEGGELSAATVDGRGEITVTGADSATVLLALGTNYVMEPRVFAASGAAKLDPYPHPHERVSETLADAAEKGYADLRAAHVADYTTYFDRVDLDLGGVVPTQTTDVLRTRYGGAASAADRAYLEELYFQYGRYLLISSSRKGALPANLQGVWNAFDSSPWGVGYWHNINVQMNYWPAFTTNLAEMFESYSDYNAAYLDSARSRADAYIAEVNPAAKAPDGQNGWALGTSTTPYETTGPNPTSHSGPGTGAFTSLLFKDYVDFTQDTAYLEDVAFPRMLEMARFLDKTLKDYDGTFLVEKSASPEQRQNGVHYRTTGAAFDQQMVYENLKGLLGFAERLGIESPELERYRATVDHLEPVLIGRSGQVKEYREETTYGQIGDPTHRHISQLVGLHPGTAINSGTDAWLDAARYTLTRRGDEGTGWSKAHKINLWARAQDGEKAHDLLANLLTDSTLPNLWDTHPPFQIDGNFGGTNGIAEMLLQSVDGVIEPLAAVPEAWADGSYRGLSARGGFTVDAAWANGTATSFTIDSNAGEPVRLQYGGIASGAVEVHRERDGATVSFARDGHSQITFDTEQGESYRVSNIPQSSLPAAPSDLEVDQSTATAFSLTWKPAAGAAKYNVYVARDSEPAYELLATTSVPYYVYTPDSPLDADQAVFTVRSVSESGVVNPDGPTRLVIPSTSNVLQGKPITSSRSPYNASFPVANANDGNVGTRFAYPDNSGRLVLTVDLTATHSLDGLSIAEFVDARTDYTSRIRSLLVESTTDGTTWSRVHSGGGLGQATGGSRTLEAAFAVQIPSATQLRFTIDPVNNAFSPSVWELRGTGEVTDQGARPLGLDRPVVARGEEATLIGTGFGDTITGIELAGQPVTPFTVTGPTSITFTVPDVADGTHPLVVVEGDRRSAPVAVTVAGTLPPVLNVEVTADSRCVSGKAQLTVTARNTQDVPVSLSFESAFGTKRFGTVPSGKSAFHAFTTRLKDLPAAEVTVTATATIDGTEVTVDETVAYPARSCS